VLFLGLLFYITWHMKKYFILLILLFFSCKEIFANHTKGGWMYYEYLGPGTNDPSKLRYKIGLNLYIECNSVLIEPTWNFSFFNGSAPYNFLQNIAVTASPDFSITGCRTNNCYPCIVNIPERCYKIINYETIVELAPSVNGYIISKQRCCRVTGISNIAGDSKDYGATYTIKIPGSGISSTAPLNSSPKFIFNDTAVVCGNSPFSINFQATDDDGDSLVYSFVSAYQGGDNGTNPNPETASTPSYLTIPYLSPYSGFQPLGSGSTINSRTGVISGVAPPTGEYVICVLVKEYRNGINIGESRKELHLETAPCNPLAANPTFIPVTCDGFTVTLTEASSGNPTTFFWEFGDPASGAANTSSLQVPTHTFTDTGVFKIKLVVSIAGQCIDSVIKPLGVYPGFFPDFTVAGQCKNTPIQFRDISRADYGIINSWKWDFGDAGSPTNTSIIQNPTHTYTTAKSYNVSFIVTSSKGCIDTVPKTIVITDKPALELTNDTLICIIDTLQLNAVGTGTFLWSPNYNINSLVIPSPLVSPDVTTTYRVTLTDPFGCSGTDSVKVSVVSAVTQSAPNDTTICQTDAVVLKLISDALYYQWIENPAGNTLNNPKIKNPIATPVTNTIYTVIGSIGKCTVQSDVDVKVVPYPNADAGADPSICFGFSAQLNASGGSSYSWLPATFLNNRLIPNPVSQNPTASIRYIVTVTDTLGCPKPVNDTVLVNVIKIKADAGPSDTSVVLNQPLLLNATGSNNYLWNPPKWLSNIGIYNPISFPQDNITYKVKVFNDIGCFDYDTIRVHLFKLDPSFYVPSAFTPNGDGTNDFFRPKAIGMKTLDIFRVYNRWGQLLFTSTDIEGRGWDGTFKGKGQEPATYVWYAEGTDYLNVKVKKKGYVVLIR
jgi:gliding motility-associated-like protein